MLGQHVAYDRVAYFFTDQYDPGMEYTGCVEREQTSAYLADPGRGCPRSGSFGMDRKRPGCTWGISGP